MSLTKLRKELFKFKDSEQAKNLSGFFKTGNGDYGEGDKFLGIKMEPQRVIAQKYKELPFSSVQSLLDSKYHEERMLGLLILLYKYQGSDDKEVVYKFYLKNWKAINNWDLVDVTTPQIVGDYLLDKDRDVLYKLVASNNLWKKRIAILATFPFIKKNQFEDILKISKILLQDKHDLIHKAVGWMLREVGKRDMKAEEEFLKKHYKKMPRTMLRYAIERFPEERRQAYLKGKK